MTDPVIQQTLMLSGLICLLENKGRMITYLRLGQLWFSILRELHTKLAAFGASQHYVKWNSKVPVNGVGSSKVIVGKYYGQRCLQLRKAASSSQSVAARPNAVEDVNVINLPFRALNYAVANVKMFTKNKQHRNEKTIIKG